MARVAKFATTKMKAKTALKSTVKMLTSWSSSRYFTYELCALKAKLSFLDKLPQPEAPALANGDDVHKMAEGFIKGVATFQPKRGPFTKSWEKKLERAQATYPAGVLPPPLQRFAPLFKKLSERFKKKMMAMTVEETWAFRKDWSSTVYNDWAECWLRIKVDCAYEIKGDILIIRDWKSGKLDAALEEQYLETLQLYALGGLLMFPHIKEVRPCLDYLDLGVTHPADPEGPEPLSYVRADIPKLKKLWEGRTKAMLSDTQFAPRPNDKCKWCAYGQAGAREAGTDPKKAPCKF